MYHLLPELDPENHVASCLPHLLGVRRNVPCVMGEAVTPENYKPLIAAFIIGQTVTLQLHQPMEKGDITIVCL